MLCMVATSLLRCCSSLIIYTLSLWGNAALCVTKRQTQQAWGQFPNKMWLLTLHRVIKETVVFVGCFVILSFNTVCIVPPLSPSLRMFKQSRLYGYLFPHGKLYSLFLERSGRRVMLAMHGLPEGLWITHLL